MSLETVITQKDLHDIDLLQKLPFFLARQEISPLLQHDGSLTYSQDPATNYCPEPDKSNSHTPTKIFS
jgi:hypothetical protein